MSTVWDYFGNLQSKLTQKPGTQNPALTADGKVPFGVTADIATNLPQNPGGFNNAVEDLRKWTLEQAKQNIGTKEGIKKTLPALIVPGVGVPLVAMQTATYGISQLDSLTEGKVSTALMAGSKNLRSNYAFVNDLTRHNAAMGFLSALELVAGATLGGIAGFGLGALAGGVGAIPGALAGAAIGAGIAGKGARDLSQTGMLGQTAKKSANLSESAQGQKLYNFGTDATRLAGEIVGILPSPAVSGIAGQVIGSKAKSAANILQDTDKGIGAVVSGLLNFGFEVSAALDMKAAKLGGVAIRGALVGGIAEAGQGPLANMLAKTETASLLRADRLETTVETINKTVAGEKTPMTPIMDFNKNSTVSEILQHPLFKDNPAGVTGANLVAGKSFEEQGLLFRIGIGDAAAIAELEAKHPATFAELLRLEGVFDTLDLRNPFGSDILPQHDMLKGRIVEASTVIENEIKDLRGKYSWLNKALTLDSAMQERTFSRFSGIENLRIDMAKQRAVNKIGSNSDNILSRETRLGRTVQTVYQKNALSVPVRFIERALDDAPHSTINFNDQLQSFTGVRTTLRKAVDRNILPQEEATFITESFARAKTETEKLAVVEKIENRVFEQVANKYGIPASMKDAVLNHYIKMTRTNVGKAKNAKLEGKAYMLEDGEVVRDVQLISQLANGAYLPDVVLVDKAFAKYAKKHGAESKLPINVTTASREILDEFNSLWRTFTLARAGFPINIIRDSTLRTWGDGMLFESFANLSQTAIEEIAGLGQKINAVRRWSTSIVNPKENLAKIRKDISTYENTIKNAENGLKSFKYNPEKPPKVMPDDLVRNLKYLEETKATLAELRRQENAIIQKIPSKRVGPDKTNVEGYDFPAAFSGRIGEMSLNKLKGKNDIRALVGSTRELNLATIRRDRNGGHAVKAIDNEDLHLSSWEVLLNGIMRNDEVSRQIMSRNAKNMDPVQVEKEVTDWIRSSGSTDLFERFGYDAKFRTQMKVSDAKAIYQRSLAAINQFAPDIKLQQLIMADKVTALELKKMYPEIEKRPDVISDLALDLTGKSNLVRWASNQSKNAVTWLATQPTSVLSYSPYFKAKYEMKLQRMVALANQQGRKLSDMNQKQFELTARKYAENDYRAKINAFNRDMNYAMLFKYIMAFFPAVVEQWRAYGRLTLEHPDFAMKVQALAMVPDYIGNVQVDQYGTEYIETTLPALGIKARLPVSWFDAKNPTGGHILSASPAVTAAYNEIAKRKDMPDFFTQLILPFGVQANAMGALTPSTVKRTGQAIQAFITKNGEQFNKDMSMFIELKRKEFTDEYHVDPSGSDMKKIENEAKKDAKYLSAIRAIGAGVLPAQPRYVTPLEVYSDILGRYIKQYGADGAEKFTLAYPDFYLLADKLTDSTSGIRPDDTAIAIIKKNANAINGMVRSIDKNNLSVLGSVFNDDDYQFSSAARAYLSTNSIPGTRKRFQSESDAMDAATSSIVNKGWKDWNYLIEVVTQEIVAENLSPATGYGKSILDKYKNSFIEKMKTQNNLWYQEKKSPTFGNKRNDTIDVLTIAINDNNMWSDLGKQTRWHTIVDYLNFRYYIKEALDKRGAAITSDKAIDIRKMADTYVANLRREDVNFGKFYDRYFDGDTFDYVYEEVSKGVKIG